MSFCSKNQSRLQSRMEPPSGQRAAQQFQNVATFKFVFNQKYFLTYQKVNASTARTLCVDLI